MSFCKLTLLSNSSVLSCLYKDTAFLKLPNNDCLSYVGIVSFSFSKSSFSNSVSTFVKSIMIQRYEIIFGTRFRWHFPQLINIRKNSSIFCINLNFYYFPLSYLMGIFWEISYVMASLPNTLNKNTKKTFTVHKGLQIEGVFRIYESFLHG